MHFSWEKASIILILALALSSIGSIVKSRRGSGKRSQTSTQGEDDSTMAQYHRRFSEVNMATKESLAATVVGGTKTQVQGSTTELSAEEECQDLLAHLNPNSATHVCPANKGCPQECAKSLKQATKCVGHTLDPVFLQSIDALGFGKVGTTFDLTVFLSMLARSFLAEKSSLYNCTTSNAHGFDLGFDLGKFLGRDPTGAIQNSMSYDGALQAFRMSTLSVCSAIENKGECHPQCNQIIEALGNAVDKVAVDKAAHYAIMKKVAVDKEYLLRIAPEACQCTLREQVFGDKYTCPMYATDTYMAPYASVSYLCVLLLLALALRVKFVCFQKVHMSAGLIGGFLGLAIRYLALLLSHDLGKWIEDFWMTNWDEFGSFLTNVIFASIFIGTDMLSGREMFDEGGHHLCFAQIFFQSQHVIGLGLSIIFAALGSTMPSYGGYNLPMSFVGGHSNCFAIKKMYETLEWDAGVDTCLLTSSVGMVGGVLIGVLCVNIARYRGLVEVVEAQEGEDQNSNADIIPPDAREPGTFQATNSEAIESLGLQFGIVFTVMFIAYIISRSLNYVEVMSEEWAGILTAQGIAVLPSILHAIGNIKIFSFFPFFALNLLVGMMITSIFKKIGIESIIDRPSIDRLAGLSFDALLVAAIASTDVQGALDNIVPLLTMCACGFAFNLMMIFFIAPRFFIAADKPYSRGFFEFGTNSGTTPIGLMLMAMVDPNAPAAVHRSISISLMINCPLIGVYMAISINLLINYGALSLLLVSCGVLGGFIFLWAACFRPSLRLLQIEAQASEAGPTEGSKSRVSMLGKRSSLKAASEE